MMIGKASLREIVENALDQVDFDHSNERRRAVSVLLGAVNLYMDDDRKSALEALSSMPRAQEALRKFWRMSD
jgi:hypothetical protein